MLERVQQLEAAAAEGAAAARRAAEMSAAAEAAAERERALQAQVEGAAARSLDKGALTAVLQAEQSRLNTNGPGRSCATVPRARNRAGVAQANDLRLDRSLHPHRT